MHRGVAVKGIRCSECSSCVAAVRLGLETLRLVSKSAAAMGGYDAYRVLQAQTSDPRDGRERRTGSWERSIMVAHAWIP